MNKGPASKLRILYIAPLDSIHSRRWITFFAEKGYEVHALDLDETPQTDLEGMSSVVFHRIPQQKSLFSSIKYVGFLVNMIGRKKRLGDILEAVKPDLVHVHYIDVRSYLASRFSYPLLLTAWGSDILIHPKQSRWFRYFVTKSLAGAGIVTCDADHMKGAIQQFGVPENRVKVIYFGTDMTKFNPGKRDPNLGRELGFPPGSKLVISLRSLKPIYDIPTFVRAVSLVAKECKEARFIIASGGPERDNLELLARDLGVSDLVRFAGRLSDEDMQRYTASSDIYVSTSLSDGGLAASTAEAMACQVPVVITDFGDNGNWVERGKGGLLFPLKDHAALAEKIIFLLKNPDHAARIAMRGREIIDERNNWHREMEKIENLYRQVAGNKSV